MRTILLAGVLLSACSPVSDTKKQDTPAPPPSIVDILVKAMAFEAPDTIPSGWVTFRLINKSPMLHFGILERLPPGKHLADQQRDIAPKFQNIMDGINGKPLSEPDAGMELPEWFGEIIFLSGPGLTSKGMTSETTLYVEPGTYLLECYIKTNGLFHSYNPDPKVNGMVHEFEVIDRKTDQEEPEANVRIDVSIADGFQVQGEFTSGKQTVGVHFQDQKVYSNYLGHDVHVVRLTQETSDDQLLSWMNWVNTTGMETPAPAEFLGGTHEMPAGSTAYFNIDLEPGTYALIAEVPDADSLGMYSKFEVKGN